MAREIATAESVAAAAEALLAEGLDPSTKMVLDKIGGGSYTTIGRHLDAWRAARKTAPPAVALPADLEARALDAARALWSGALSIAGEQIAAARAEAERQVGEARSALAGAEQIIARGEALAESQASAIADLQQRLDARTAQLDQALFRATGAEARAEEQARQIAHQTGALVRLREELGETTKRMLDQARQLGELDALRAQVAAQRPRVG